MAELSRAEKIKLLRERGVRHISNNAVTDIDKMSRQEKIDLLRSRGVTASDVQEEEGGILDEITDTGGALVNRALQIGLNTVANPRVKFPSMEQVEQKTGETASSFANFLPALASIPGMLTDREGRKQLAMGALETFNVKDRFEQGDIAGLAADAFLTKGGMGAMKNALKKRKRFSGDGADGIDTDLLEDNRISSNVMQTLSKVKDKGGQLVQATKNAPIALINAMNKKAGLPVEAKKQLREIANNPAQMEKFNGAIAENISPTVAADKARELVRDRRSAQTTEFGQGLARIDLSVEVPGWESVKEGMKDILETSGVVVKNRKSEIVDTGSFEIRVPDAETVEVPGMVVGRKLPEEVDVENFSPYVAGDKTAAEAILREANKLKNGSLRDMRQALLNLGALQKSKDFLDSGLGDMLLARATGKIRTAIADAAKKHDLPEAQQLLDLNEGYRVETRKLDEITRRFSIRPDQDPQTTAKKMIGIYESGFEKENVALLENLDRNREVIPIVLGYKAREIFPPQSQFLSHIQFLGAAGLTGGGIFGLSAAIPSAALALPLLTASSPRIIAQVTMGMPRAKASKVIQGLQKVREKIPPHLLKGGITVGAALERLQNRGSDVLTDLSTIQE